MANLMNMVKLSAKPSRNGFDMSFKNNFSQKAGEIRPCFIKPVLPGDVWNIDLKSFTRLQPVNTAAYARMREYYDFYFVPMELLWNKFDTVATQMKNNLQHASGLIYSDNVAPSGAIPYVTSEQLANYVHLVRDMSNLFGYSRAYGTCVLLEYLGYGSFYEYLKPNVTWSSNPMTKNLQLSILPLLAYQHIYADYFRYTQWERTNPSTFNVDYIKGTDDLNVDISQSLFMSSYNFLDLRYCNFNKDMIFGILPNAQYGDTAECQGSVVGSSLVGISLMNRDGSSPDAGALNVSATGSLYTSSILKNLTLKSGLQSSFSILQLRMAEATQRWKEIAQSVDEDYKSQIDAQWGIKVSDFLSHQSRYLGGTVGSLDINPVINQNLTGDSETDIRGVGTMYNNGHIRFESKGEYGYIIGIHHIVPTFDYQCDGVDPLCTDTDITDFPVPAFDRIGMQQLPSYVLSNPVVTGTSSSPDASYYIKVFLSTNPYLGYVPRYVPWKTSLDVSRGAFTSTLQSWCIPFDKSILAEYFKSFIENGSVDIPSDNSNVPKVGDKFISWIFFKVNPAVLDPIFSVNADDSIDTDQFLVSAFFDAKVVRNLDVNGLPW